MNEEQRAEHLRDKQSEFGDARARFYMAHHEQVSPDPRDSRTTGTLDRFEEVIVVLAVECQAYVVLHEKPIDQGVREMGELVRT